MGEGWIVLRRWGWNGQLLVGLGRGGSSPLRVLLLRVSVAVGMGNVVVAAAEIVDVVVVTGAAVPAAETVAIAVGAAVPAATVTSSTLGAAPAENRALIRMIAQRGKRPLVDVSGSDVL